MSLHAHEAVAIVQALIANTNDGALTEPAGPPSLENVMLDGDGTVVCRACAATPAVFETAVLLDAMLPRGGAMKVPGALRYTVARALLEVDAPPFDSLAELASTLERHERGERRDVLRRLYARGAEQSTLSARGARVVDFPERRRSGPTAAALRRELRAADEQIFRSRTAIDEPIVSVTRVIELPSEAPLREEPLRQEPLHEAPLREPQFDAALLNEAPLSMPEERQPRRLIAWLGAGAAAALVSFGAGYATVTRMLPLTGQPRVGATTPRTAAPLAPTSRTSPSSELSSESSSAAPSSPTPAAKAPPAVVRAIAPTDAEPASPASYVSNGTPLFDGSFGVMTIADGGAHSDHVQPSPDGSRIAFDSDRDGERAVYVANRDGTGVMRVSGDGDAAMPTWSPDGRQLAFARAEADRPHVWNLWLTTLADGSARRLTGFRSGQTWSGSWFPDGRQIAYTHDDRLAILDLESGAVRDYLSPVRKREVRTAAVSPDGEHVIFQVAGNGAWLLDLEDGSMRCVLTDPSAEQFAWSRDGRRVAYHSRRDGQWAMWLMGPR